MKKSFFTVIATFSVCVSTSFAIPGFDSGAEAVSKVIEAVAKGGADLSESVGCGMNGGIKADELDILQKVRANGDITVGEQAKLELALVSGLCVEGKSKIEQDIETKKIRVEEGGCASIGVVGSAAGC